MNQNQKFKVKQFEWFQMQTKVRQMIQQIIQPIQKRIMQHSTSLHKLKTDQSQQTQKVQQLTMMVTNDPKIFQQGVFKQVDLKFEHHQKSLEQMRRLIQQQNQYVSKKFELVDIRMRQSNEVMRNFSLLKERLHEQVDSQNVHIDRIRLNLEKMIGDVGGQIKMSNDSIVQNKMIFQKMDNCLCQKIRNLQLDIAILKQSVQDNKKSILEKNIQLQNHEFKFQKAFEKLKQMQIGQSMNIRMEQFMKDLQISIKKAQFRIQALNPLITMAQVQQALQYILPQKMRKKITIFGYKKYSKFNKQILQKHYDEVRQKFNGMELVEQMQKKNTRQITQLKRKKIISMGIDIDHLTFQARQRYYQEVDMDQLSQQEQDNQSNAKIDEAQILNLVSLYFNQFTTDVSEKVKNQLDDTKAYLYGMESQIKKQMQMNEEMFKKSQNHCSNLHRDQMLQMKATQNKLEEVYSNHKQVLLWLDRGQQIQRKVYNLCSLMNHLLIQEEIDKQNISLMGIQQHKNSPQKSLPRDKNSVIEIEKNCFSCCGYPASVLSSFKMACLAYQPSEIIIDSKPYKRQEILQFTTNILQTIKKNLQKKGTEEQSFQVLKQNDQYSMNQLGSIEVGDKVHDTLPAKSKLQISTTYDLSSKMTVNQFAQGQYEKRRSSIRLRKSIRANNPNSDHKSISNSKHLRSHSISKQMTVVTNNFIELKKKHLSYLN